MPADLPVAAPDPAAIRERAEYAVSAEFADMLLDAPEDSPRWAAWLGADALALLAARQQDKERIERLETALTQAIQVIEWCGLNDRTTPYEYGESRCNGDKPAVGAAFNTPREFASWWPDRLRVALAVEEDAHG